VRNRKSYFNDVVEQQARKAGGAEVAVLNIASGPGRDVSEFLSKGSYNVCFDCIEQDSKAIAYAVALCQDQLDPGQFHKGQRFKVSASEML
jgi:hypothetical protein